jgi:hypothetical protein
VNRAILIATVLLFGCPEEDGQMLDDASIPDRGVDSGVVDTGVLDTGTRPDGGPDAAADAEPNDAADEDAALVDASDDGGVRTCASDPECAPDGWCRVTVDGGMACTPYVAEGEYCGGFVPPEYETRCSPEGDVACNTFQFIPDSPGICSIRATVADLVAQPARYDGHWVNVYPAFLTDRNLTCTPQSPCNAANACAADEVAGDTMNAATTIELLDPNTGAPLNCSGTECDYRDNCPYPVDMERVIVGPFSAQGPSIEAVHVNEGF